MCSLLELTDGTVILLQAQLAGGSARQGMISGGRCAIRGPSRNYAIHCAIAMNCHAPGCFSLTKGVSLARMRVWFRVRAHDGSTR
jgi:hypothetical protein